jgi:hypothetical protein
MIPARNFTSVFMAACNAKVVARTDDVAFFDEHASATDLGRPLICFGTSGDRFTFSEQGVEFKDRGGSAGKYSWEQLDFILPFDLSMASDKLYTFTSVKREARAIALRIGYGIAIAMFVVLIYLLVSYVALPIAEAIGDFFSSLGPIGWILLIGFALFFGWLGAILTAAAVAVVVSLISAAVASVLSGGLAYGIAMWFAEWLQPFIERIILERVQQFKNGICVIKEMWVKSPSGTQTTEILDFILIGIKLRRAGLK